MTNHETAMVFASFAGDSLALGVHWIYDPKQIEKSFGRVSAFVKPKPDSYHPTKEAGDFTHYGDQTFVLLESLASMKKFDPSDFSRRWQTLFKDYNGYHDHATKDTLRNLFQGKTPLDAGSSSEELAGAARLAPLVLLYRNDLDALVEAARTQTRMTHNHPMVVDGAEFFARIAWMVLKGRSPIEVMEEVAMQRFPNTPISKWVLDGVESRSKESTPTILAFGQSCHYGDAFPGVVHLLAKYENNLEEALIQAVMAGGDSAGRAMIVGMVLGAYLGRESFPDQWTAMNRYEDIVKHIEEIL